jgi:cytochrome c oxidase subunit III
MMIMSIKEEKERSDRSKKLLLLFGMLSMFMMFAGLTSAYIVSASRKDWLHEMVLPSAFTFSTIVIVMSSITFHFAKLAIKRDDRKNTTLFLLGSLVLGIAFVFFQFKGFGQLVEMGYNLTGPTSTISATFIYMLAFLHMVHLFAGIISLLIIIYNHFKQKYNSSQTIGIELGAMFWHFLDLLWIFLFLFLYFV